MNASYAEKVRTLSKKIVKAQKPIRVLDAIKWDDAIEEKFRRSGFKELPKIDQKYYRRIPLHFHPQHKLFELKEIIHEIHSYFSAHDPLARLLVKTVEQYIEVVHMLMQRGTREFGRLSRKLYGSPKDRFLGDTNDIVSLSQLLYDILSNLDETKVGPPVLTNRSPREAVKILSHRFEKYFPHHAIEVKLSDGILADAAAGSNYIKINSAARFSDKQIDVLEVHEGWTHVATTYNGKRQRYAKWLAKGPPRCATTQEGLAVLMEVLTLRSYPHRAHKINDRVRGVDMAEDGADVVETFNFFRDHHYSEDESYRAVMRIYRGGLVTGGAPFTKDIAYCRGFIENYNFIRTAIRHGKPELVRFLFAGKLHVYDIPLLYQKYLEGLVDPPACLPPPFLDLSGVAVWMAFSNFLNQVNLQSVQRDYERLFKRYL